MKMRTLTETSAGKIAFTLVELLVVIAVVALLAALLLPALGKAKAQSRAMACLANARQIGILHQQYSSDFNGHVLSPSTGGSWHSMEILLRLYMGDKRAGVYLGPLHPFFRCPVATYPSGVAAADTVGYFYGVNATLYEAKKTKVHALVNPSRSFLLAENNQQAYSVIYAPAASNTALNMERHGRCSVMFNDSHAGILDAKKVPSKTSYPSVADGTLINTYFASDTPPTSSTFLGL